MSKWAGILASVFGSGLAGGSKAFGDKLKEDRREKARRLRDENIARLHSMYRTDEIELSSKLAGKREESERTWKTGQKEKEREFLSEEAEKERRSKEKIASMRSERETTTEKRFQEDQAIKNVSVALESVGIPVQQTESGLIMAQIPVDKKGMPKDPSVLKLIDDAGLSFRTGKPVKTENNWFSPDEYMMPVFIGGLKPKGVLSSGVNATTDLHDEKGLSAVDKLFKAADKKLGRTKKKSVEKSMIDTADISASEIYEPKKRRGIISGTW